MKNKVTALANDCGHAAMDIGLLARDEEEDRHQSNPMGEQERIALDIAELEKKQTKPETACWHCKEKGHVAIYGLEKSGGEKGTQSARKGRGKNGWWGKGASKGGYGKGNKGVW